MRHGGVENRDGPHKSFFSFKTRASLINVSARDVMSAGRRGCGNCVYTHAVASRRHWLRGNV